MIKGKELLGRHVVDLSTGERIDSVRDIVFDHGANLVLGLVVDGGGNWLRRRDRLIPFSTVYSVGEDAVMITSAQEASSEAEQARMQEVLASDVNLVGMALVTGKGEDLGRIADVAFDEYSGQVEGYEVTGGLFAKGAGKTAFMPAPQGTELKVGKDSATVPDSIAEQMRRSAGRWPTEARAQESRPEEVLPAATQPAIAQPAIAQPTALTTASEPESAAPQTPLTPANAEQAEALAQKRREALVGRVAGASIVLPDGTVVAEKGAVITEEQVIRAERSGRLMVMYNTLQPADESPVQAQEQVQEQAAAQTPEVAPSAPLDPLDVGEYQRQPAPSVPVPSREEVTAPPVAEATAQARLQPEPQPEAMPQPEPEPQPQPPQPAKRQGHAMRVRPEQVIHPDPTPDFKPGLLDQAKGWLANLREDLTTDPQQRELVQVHEQTGTPIQRLEDADFQAAQEVQAAPQAPQESQSPRKPQPAALAQAEAAAPQPKQPRPQAAPTPAPEPAPVPPTQPQPGAQPQPEPKPAPRPHSVPAQAETRPPSAPDAANAAALNTDIDLDIDLTPLTRAAAPAPAPVTAPAQPKPQPQTTRPQPKPQIQAAQTAAQTEAEASAPAGTTEPKPAPATQTVPEPRPVASRPAEAEPTRSQTTPAPEPTPAQAEAPAKPAAQESKSASKTEASESAKPAAAAANTNATDLAAFNQAIEAIVKSAYGWPVTRTIQAPTGEIVLEEGGRVNAAVVEEARRLGVLRELLGAVARGES